jgi:tetratricopeptide (TPR) repeat protein
MPADFGIYRNRSGNTGRHVLPTAIGQLKRFRFRPSAVLLSLIFSVLFSALYPQQATDSFHSTDPTDQTQKLINTYLSNTGDAPHKIRRLLDLSNKDQANRDFKGRMEKIQIALILEKYVKEPCRATFDLNFTMGEIFREINIQYAVFYYQKAIDIGKQSKEPTELFTTYNILAGFYLKLHDHQSVLKSYHSAMLEAAKGSTVAVSSVNNNIGWFYSKIGKDDSAMVYFQKAAAYYDKNTTNDDLYANIIENMAKVYERRGQKDKALEIFNGNDRLYKRENNFGKLIANRINIFRVKTPLNEQEVQRSLDSLAGMIEKHAERIDPRDVLPLYQFACEYFIGKKNVANAGYYYKKCDQLKDSITKKDIETSGTITNALLQVQTHGFKAEYKLYQLELQAAKEASDKNKIIAVLFLISAVLMLIALTFFTQKRKKELELTKQMAAAGLKAKELEAKAIKAELENTRLNSEAEMQKKDMERRMIENAFEMERLLTKAELGKHELERRAIQNELELKKKDLTNVILLNTKVHESNKEMIGRLQDLSSKSDLQKSLKDLIADLKSKSLVGERLSSLQTNIDYLNTEFYQKLKLKFPNLTKAEVELCGYMLINLSSKDIAVLKNVEPASVKMSKTRLRKKLGINPEDDLLNFIKAL